MDILDKFSPQPKSSVLAVDIGYQNIKYLWLKKSRKQWIVENFGKISYQEDTEVPAEGLSKSISRLPFDPKKLKSSTVVIGLTPERYKVCKRSYPKLPAKELNQMVLFDLQREVMGEGESGEILYYLKSAGADLNQVDQIGYVLVGAAEEDVVGQLHESVHGPAACRCMGWARCCAMSRKCFQSVDSSRMSLSSTP